MGRVDVKTHRKRCVITTVVLVLLGIALGAGRGMAQEDPAVPAEPREEEEVLGPPTTYEAPTEELSVLSIQSRPSGATVFVDGEERGVTPLYIKDLEDTGHEVILYMPGYGAFRQMIQGTGGRIFLDLDAEQGLGVGFVSLVSEPPDARIDVDAKRVGLSPLEVPLAAGRHTVRFSKPGFKPAEAVVEVEPDGRHAVEVQLAPMEGALLVISSPVGAEVFLDGEAVGSAWEPLRLEGVAPGTHSVRLEKAGYRSWERTDVEVRSVETTTVLAALLPERDYSWVRLFTEPSGARVWLDGREVGIAGEEGLGFKASKGAHSLRLQVDPATQPGFEPLQTTVNFTEDEVDYADNPLQLPPVDENLVHARQLIGRGQQEEALGFLDRVTPEQAGYGEARLLVVELLDVLGRESEIPGELARLLDQDQYRNNPVLNLALGYWGLRVGQDAGDGDAVGYLNLALEGLDRAAQSADLFPPPERPTLTLKTHYYAGMASEILFNLTGERRFVKKGVQSWDVFFARLNVSPDALEDSWIERAQNHRRSLEFLAKKLGS